MRVENTDCLLISPGGAGALNMDTGAQFGNTEFADNKPQDTTYLPK